MSTPSASDEHIITTLSKYGSTNYKKLDNSLQGSIWCAEIRGQKCVVKVTSKEYDARSIAIRNNQEYEVQENIKKESEILQWLTVQNPAPDTIVKYIDLFASNDNYYLVMENGGHSLFEFVQRAHALIKSNKLSITEWLKCVSVIFGQLVNAIDYIHSHSIAHFDISIENVVITDVAIKVDSNDSTISLQTDSIRIKLIDFGLAESVHKNGKSTKFVGKSNYKSPEVTANIAFDPFANDIWCLGVCLFMMVVGCCPFETASPNDAIFQSIINKQLVQLLQGWGRLHYVTADILHLLSVILQYETKRVSLKDVLNHKWINRSC